MLEHPAANDGIEGLVGIGKPGQVGGDVGDARSLERRRGACNICRE